MMADKYDEENPIDEKAAVYNHGRNKDPLERMLAMKDEQIRELKNDLVKKENEMDERDKDAREEISKREKELREAFEKKDQEWMEKVEELRGQLGKGNNELNESKIELQTAIGTGERYWMATLILTVIIIACVAVIIERQVEVNSCWSIHSECRNKIEELVEVKGKIEVKTNHAVILKEQTDQFLNRTFSNEDRAIKGIEDCQKRLRDMETSVRKLLMNVTSLAVERDKLATKYNLCSEQLAVCEATKTS